MYSNRWYSNFGPLVRRFESDILSFLQEHNGAQDCFVGTFSSATTALELVLKAIHLPKGSRVLVPALTFPATALAVLNVGMIPVLADVAPESWELTPEIAENALSEKAISVVMPVAAFGKPVDSAGWAAFQQKTGVPVVLDAAAALGQQDILGELIYCFSLHATKPFGVGEGGLLVTGNEDLVIETKSLSNFGFQGPAGVVREIGTNAKFGEYYAAVGLAQIGRWQEVMDRRTAVLDQYKAGLHRAGNSVSLQQGTGNFIPAVFPVYAKGRAKALEEKLADAGIHTRRWYLPPLYEHPGLKGMEGVVNLEPASFPVCEDLKESLLGLPFHGFLTAEDTAEISNIVAEETA
ncbi:MAG: DegT/DnrJ/EryC1/StrS family aminotransferase [Alphaproteobacteria bacterium]|nr:DegT/DnrJ/EryC1/StrS family aminotransferase [Alphaproteobacteria bacterium]